MNTHDCTYYEEQASALLDQELGGEPSLELTDHLVRCGSCRRFWVAARELDGLVAVLGERGAANPPRRELWRRIERSAAPAARRRGLRMLQAAAAIVIAVGLGWAVLWGPGASRPSDAVVQLGEDAGAMTDARFVELARELLRADPRYHVAMNRVMEQVLSDTRAVETAVDYDVPARPEPEFAEETVASRLPV